MNKNNSADNQFDEVALLTRWPRNALTPHRNSAISCANSDKEIHRIGRLRYDLFIERDGKSYSGANHETRAFIEAIDKLSLNFQVILNSRHVAAVRLTRAIDGLDDLHLNYVVRNAALTDGELSKTVINSRLAVLPEMRARIHIPDLFRYVYKTGILSGAIKCIVSARPDVGPLFVRFGFRKRPVSYIDPIGGLMEVYVLEMYNRDVLSGGLENVLTDLEATGQVPTSNRLENANV